ncbi:6,7-dimethyl-8-ribityllumazine synthase [Pelagibacterium halotolerans]|uniref:6,7-dimethyl-8-ribityllumazine synthase n=1 Tax=Pelagibacterium halotolerans TaxID=531813 RepID=UPI00384B2666
MAVSGDTHTVAPGSAKGQHYLIVEARFYSDLADALLEGATKAFGDAGASFDVVTVPGALEIPAAIAMASDLQGEKYDGYVALGCVIRGETTHYEIVSNESARALMDLTIADGIALGNGILTVENENQAWVRARISEQNKGGGAAVAAMTMVALKTRLED